MLIRPYGERPDDGALQLSFTLPVDGERRGRAAAERLCQRMGLHSIHVAHAEDMGNGLVFCVVHARTDLALDPGDLEDVRSDQHWSIAEVDRCVAERLGRPLIVVGATLGVDAHTVGLDSILSAKGAAGTPGLEAYQAFDVRNLGGQVAAEVLVRAVQDLQADCVLISQVVTHNDIHKRTLSEFGELLKAEGHREKVVMIVGGPRIDSGLSRALGFDAGFGAGASPAEVAECLVRMTLRRLGFNE